MKLRLGSNIGFGLMMDGLLLCNLGLTWAGCKSLRLFWLNSGLFLGLACCENGAGKGDYLVFVFSYIKVLDYYIIENFVSRRSKSSLNLLLFDESLAPGLEKSVRFGCLGVLVCRENFVSCGNLCFA